MFSDRKNASLNVELLPVIFVCVGFHLLQSVQTVVEFALAVKSQQPNLLPPGAELVESWVSSGDLHGCLLLLLLLLVFAC